MSTLPVNHIPFIISDRIDYGNFYAEVEPAPNWWLPWRGRTSRWWFEIMEAKPGDDYHTTHAYQPGGSGGAFTLGACIGRAADALDRFAGNASLPETTPVPKVDGQYLYIAQRLWDSIDCKMVDIGYFPEEDGAIRAIQGLDDGQVIRCEMGLTHPSFVVVHGYRKSWADRWGCKNWADRWGYGWMDLGDAPAEVDDA